MAVLCGPDGPSRDIGQLVRAGVRGSRRDPAVNPPRILINEVIRCRASGHLTTRSRVRVKHHPTTNRKVSADESHQLGKDRLPYASQNRT